VKFLNNIICAEIPDRNIDPDLYNVITSNMMHGPCGPTHPNSLCIKGGSKCIFKMHHRKPAVQRLHIHLPNQQTVTFSNDTAMVTFLNNDRLQKTILTEFFTANKQAENRSGSSSGRWQTSVGFRLSGIAVSGISNSHD